MSIIDSVRPDRSNPSKTQVAATELPKAYYEKIGATHDSIDKVQQSITAALQQIDKNFSDCYKSALSLYQELAQYHALQLESRKALETWSPLFTAAARSAIPLIPSSSNSDSMMEAQDHELLLSAIGASPLKQEFPIDVKFNSMPQLGLSKDGTLIDPVTPKANTLLFHYLRRASLANPLQFKLNALDEYLEDTSQMHHSSSSSKVESITMSPPSISISSASSLVPPSLAFISDESSCIKDDESPSATHGHSILMDFSPRIRKSVNSNFSFSLQPNHTSLFELQATPVNKISPEADPSLTLSMERLSVHIDTCDEFVPRALQFSTPSNTTSMSMDFKDEEYICEEELEATFNEKPTNFSLAHFPIVFQSGEGARQLQQLHDLFIAQYSLTLSAICSSLKITEEQAGVLLDLLTRKKYISSQGHSSHKTWMRT